MEGMSPLFFIDSEYREIERICKERGISSEQLLEEKIAPFQAKISQSEGELIAAVDRDYEQISPGILHYHPLREKLHIGIITSETKFISPQEIRHNSFILGINKPFTLELSFGTEDFREEYNNSFNSNTFHTILLPYFMERPPKTPEVKTGCFGPLGYVHETDKPRLELYIGDEEALPFLQEQLKGWQYTQLVELLDYELPITEDIQKKIESEQIDLYEQLTEEEDKVRALARKKSELKEVAKTSDLIDDVFVELTNNPQLKETRQRVERLLKTAIKRKYDEQGIKFSRRMDAGVMMEIDLKEFFSQRKAMLEL